MSQKPRIVVVGSGIGGLAAAIRLADAGCLVSVYEQNAVVGGKMSEIRDAGYRWDTGPSVITMCHVFDDLFQSVGRRLEDYLDLIPVEPLTRYFFPDGVRLDVTRDWPALAQQIAALEPRDVTGYLRYLAHAADLERITGPVFIYGPSPRLRDFARVPLRDMLKVRPWQTMHEVARATVRSPHLRQLLNRYATYVGADPYRAPSALSVIAHVELTGGVWYPRGGIYTIASALHRLAVELGVEVHTGSGVNQLLVDSGRATGVILTNGTTIQADAVVANVDVTTFYQRLARDAVPARALASMERRALSCSGFVLLLGVERVHPTLAHHNIFFAPDARREFTDVFERSEYPSDPTLYVAITSKTDPDHAPPGHENWFVLVNAPPLPSTPDADCEQYADSILDRLAQRGFDVREVVVTRKILPPSYLAEHTGAWRGALYGFSNNSPWSAFRRPHNRSRWIKGLYFAGGTTHPGGGVPMVILSARVAARMLLDDIGIDRSNV